MSELKDYDIMDIEAMDDERLEKSESGKIQATRVYIKSEADKVIAELKNEIEKQKQLRDMALSSVPNVLKVMKIIQHHKYKRCLAMARWCHNQREIYERDSYDWELEVVVKRTLWNKANIMRKWRQRWLELAEKFKDKEA